MKSGNNLITESYKWNKTNENLPMCGSVLQTFSFNSGKRTNPIKTLCCIKDITDRAWENNSRFLDLQRCDDDLIVFRNWDFVFPEIGVTLFPLGRDTFYYRNSISCDKA